MEAHRSENTSKGFNCYKNDGKDNDEGDGQKCVDEEATGQTQNYGGEFGPTAPQMLSTRHYGYRSIRMDIKLKAFRYIRGQ